MVVILAFTSSGFRIFRFQFLQLPAQQAILLTSQLDTLSHLSTLSVRVKTHHLYPTLEVIG